MRSNHNTFCYPHLGHGEANSILQQKHSTVICKPNFPEWERLDLCWTMHTPFSCPHCNKSELYLGIENCFTGPHFCSISVSLSAPSLSRCKRKCLLVAVQRTLVLKKKESSRVWCDIITSKDLILVLKLLFFLWFAFAFTSSSQTLAAHWDHLEAFRTSDALGVLHQINRNLWGLGIGKL